MFLSSVPYQDGIVGAVLLQFNLITQTDCAAVALMLVVVVVVIIVAVKLSKLSTCWSDCWPARRSPRWQFWQYCCCSVRLHYQGPMSAAVSGLHHCRSSRRDCRCDDVQRCMAPGGSPSVVSVLLLLLLLASQLVYPCPLQLLSPSGRLPLRWPCPPVRTALFASGHMHRTNRLFVSPLSVET